jgi:hydroxyacyl-ACP dehydratase HTD2-like protein with hotdog domain
MGTQVLHLRVSDELMAELLEEADRDDRSVAYVAKRRLEGSRGTFVVKYKEVFRENGDIVVAEPGAVVHLDPGEAMPTVRDPEPISPQMHKAITCPHPKARLRQTVKGKRCLDCGAKV